MNRPLIFTTTLSETLANDQPYKYFEYVTLLIEGKQTLTDPLELSNVTLSRVQ